MPKKHSVEYVKQNVPAFLQRFKEQTGYQEYDVTDKNQSDRQGDDREDREDELPQIVQLNDKDLSPEEARKLLQLEKEKSKNDDKAKSPETVEEKGEEDEQCSGRITFKKPSASKRTLNDLNTSTRSKSDHVRGSGESKKHRDKRVKAVKNSKLLSFDEEDEGDV